MSAAKNLGVDLGTSGGEWLFRQGELILGPVPAVHIVERLYSGELDGKTEVAPLGRSDFARLADVDFFKVHLAKAEAKLRVDAAAMVERSRTSRQRVVRVTAVVAVALLVAVGAAFAARYLAVHASLPVDDEALFEIEAPVIRLARARMPADEELVDYPSPAAARAAKAAAAAQAAQAAQAAPAGTQPPALGAIQPPTPGPGKPGKGEKPTRVASADKAPKAGDKGGPKMTSAGDDPDGMQTSSDFDQEAINAVVAQKQKTLYPCLKQEVERRPKLSGKIPIEFVIGNDGKVAKLWIDHPDLKTGPLFDCMLKELQKWPFKPYQGERATVTLAFKVNARK